jgi:DNA/RNA-binding domain of Phe-tRNA-synthetase-like protein
MNPNKYPSSLEALLKRVVKGSELPHVNPLVDLVNGLSLKYLVPMGAHDLKTLPGDVMLRRAGPQDEFVEGGSEVVESVTPGEIVYATGHFVRTRRWVWRQSAWSRLTSQSQYVFFPIDAFRGVTDQAALGAQRELADWLKDGLGASVQLGWVDRDHPVVAWDAPTHLA